MHGDSDSEVMVMVMVMIDHASLCGGVGVVGGESQSLCRETRRGNGNGRQSIVFCFCFCFRLLCGCGMAPVLFKKPPFCLHSTTLMSIARPKA